MEGQDNPMSGDSAMDSNPRQSPAFVLNENSNTQAGDATTSGTLPNGDSQTSTTSEEASSDDEGADPPLSPCFMTVIIQPPAEVRPGEQFHTPIVVSLESRSTGCRRTDLPENDIRYWAAASIPTQNGRHVLVGGTSVIIKRADTPPQHPDLGYLIFHNLNITEPGFFKILITLVLMPSADNPHEFGGTGTHTFGARKVDAIQTIEINVDEDAVTMPRRKSFD